MSSVLDSQKSEEENINIEQETVRPLLLKDFTGQEKVTKNIEIFINSAKKRNDVMDHTLFYGPPGLGKTTLANIVANEMGVDCRQTSGPVLTKSGDLAAILTNLKENDVLFIDEIHRLNINVEEVLYSAMEDFKIDIIIGEGASARNITLPIKPFTLIGATTRMGLISAPLRTRFGIPLNLEFYKPESLKNIVAHAAGKLHILSQEESNLEIAKRSRGTPRIAIRLLRRVRDFSYVLGNPSDDYTITPKIVKESLEQLGVDESGLDIIDLKYLNLLLESYNGGPAGIDTIAASLSEDRGTIEDTVESYLLQIGFIAKTPRGRMLTPLSFKYLGVKTPQITTENNTELF